MTAAVGAAGTDTEFVLVVCDAGAEGAVLEVVEEAMEGGN